MFASTELYLIIFSFILGHLCGSIPCGLWLCRLFYNIDIRDYGSHNIGTTNVFRTVGTTMAVVVLLADMLKGIAAVAVVGSFFTSPLLIVVTAMGAILGHNYSAFLGLKGGKGVATGLGLLLFLMPKVAAVCLIVWLLLVILTRYVSLGSITAALLAAPFAHYCQYPQAYVLFAAIAGLFVIIRHKENILRLLSGTESKIKPGKLQK